MLYSEHSLVLLSMNGEVLWHQSFGDFLSAIAFDDHSPWMALHLMKPRVSGHIKVVSITNPEQAVTSLPIESLVGYYHRTFEVIWFSHGIITVWQPSLAAVTALEPDKEYSTLFVEFNPDSLSFGQAVTRPGLYTRVGTRGDQTLYLHAQPSHTVALLSIEARVQGVKR